ncbi:MAG: hypothetical protein KAJ19_08315, partial [Gammaproteobacteria bacterium]|nr:hypothetical protein [Gammaproteobacteria bacterium]
SSSSSSINSLTPPLTPPLGPSSEKMAPEVEKVVMAWCEKNGVVGPSGRNVTQWTEAVGAHGVNKCLNYIEKIPGTQPGFIINTMNKDSATNPKPTGSPAMKCPECGGVASMKMSGVVQPCHKCRKKQTEVSNG